MGSVLPIEGDTLVSINADDMLPITRNEFHDSLAQLIGAISADTARLLAESEARIMGTTQGLIAESEERTKAAIAGSEQRLRGEMQASEQRLRVELRGDIQESEQRLTVELGMHTRASTEELTARVRVLDDKYADLPARVKRLEELAAVPAPRRRTRKS
jgi:hypothetical protein